MTVYVASERHRRKYHTDENCPYVTDTRKEWSLDRAKRCGLDECKECAEVEYRNQEQGPQLAAQLRRIDP